MLLALALATQIHSFSSSPSAQESRPGWLGVSLSVEEGRDRPLRVTQVNDGAPADRAGLRAGDRLVGLAGHELGGYEELIDLLRAYGPGREVAVTVQRSFEVELDGRGWGQPDGPRLGVHLGLQEDQHGLRWVVRKAEDGWPAARAGLAAGDRIVAVAGREPRDFDELQEVLAEVAPEHELRVVVERDLELRLGTRPDDTGNAFGGRAEAPGRFEFAPEPQQPRLRLTPRSAEPSDLERQLREEMAGLNQELRALREELRNLRRELAERR